MYRLFILMFRVYLNINNTVHETQRSRVVFSIYSTVHYSTSHTNIYSI